MTSWIRYFTKKNKNYVRAYSQAILVMLFLWHIPNSMNKSSEIFSGLLNVWYSIRKGAFMKAWFMRGVTNEGLRM